MCFFLVVAEGSGLCLRYGAVKCHLSAHGQSSFARFICGYFGPYCIFHYLLMDSGLGGTEWEMSGVIRDGDFVMP